MNREAARLRCYTSGGVFIPGCYGGAINGEHGCTCPPRNRLDEIQKLTARVERLERDIAKLRAALNTRAA
jgi:hypothetical protein